MSVHPIPRKRSEPDSWDTSASERFPNRSAESFVGGVMDYRQERFDSGTDTLPVRTNSLPTLPIPRGILRPRERPAVICKKSVPR